MARASLLLMESPPGDDEADSKHNIIKLANDEFLAHLMNFHLVPDIESTSTATQVDNKVAIEMKNLQEFGTQCKARTKDVGVGESSMKETATIATQTDQVHICETAPRAINHRNLKSVEITQDLHEPLRDKLEKLMGIKQSKSKIISKVVEKDEKRRNKKRPSRTKDEGQNTPKSKKQSKKLPRAYSIHNSNCEELFDRHEEKMNPRRHSPVIKCRRIFEEDLSSTLSTNHRLSSTRKRVHSFDEDRRRDAAHKRQTPKIHKSLSEENQQIKEDAVCLRNKRSVSIKLNSPEPSVKYSPQLISEAKTECKSEDTTVNIKPDMSHIRCKINDLLEDKNKPESPTSPDNKEDVTMKPIENKTKKSLLNEVDNNPNEICLSTAQDKDVNITENTTLRDWESYGIINKTADANKNEITMKSSETLNERKPLGQVPRQNVHAENGHNTIPNIEYQHITQPAVTGQVNDDQRENAIDNIIKTVSKEVLVMDVKKDGEIRETEMYENPVQKKMRPHRLPHKKLTQSFLNQCKTNLSSCLDSERSTSTNTHYFHKEHPFNYYDYWNDDKRNEILPHNPPLYLTAGCDMKRHPLQYDAGIHNINYRYPSPHQTPLKYGLF